MTERSTLPALAALFLLLTVSSLAAASTYRLGGGYPSRGGATDPLSLPSARHSDPTLYPQGYYDGDPLPANTIYLSFDDGPSEFTGEILDILRDNNVPATFFINSFVRTGSNGDPYKNALMAYTTTLRRMIMEGHVIGNHTFSHRNLATQRQDVIDRELDLLDQHLKEALGAEAPTLHLIRPPFGSPWIGPKWQDNQRLRATNSVNQRGILMLWGYDWDSTDSAEWVKGEWYTVKSPLYKPSSAPYAKKVQRILDHLLGLADGKHSGIILMHDMHPTSRDVLDPLIKELKRRGYAFQTLEDYCRWRWGVHVFDRFHLNDPNAVPQSPALPGIALAMLADRPFPPDQATAPRINNLRRPDQATAPRIGLSGDRPVRLAMPADPNGPSDRHGGQSLPAWFPRPWLLPDSDSKMVFNSQPGDSAGL
jgi:peptidoglycan/xylan/chitin deacetylase (PgdA/CDA1 family)